MLKYTATRKAALLDSMIGAQDMSTEELLMKIAQRIMRAKVKVPSVTVKFKNVTIEAMVSVGSRGIPTLTNVVRDGVENVVRAIIRKPDASKRRFVLLDNVSGIILPGRFTILLGPPGAGKSTLMKYLTGQLKDATLNVSSGSFTYNEQIPRKDFSIERSSAYINQLDRHVAELTVKETLEFSNSVQGSGSFRTVFQQVEAAEKEMGITPDPQVKAYMDLLTVNNKNNILVPTVIKLLGLDVCQNTVIGNDLLKGVSGGQRKRVTTAEMIVASIKVLFMDEISTGLDSATTYQITKSMKNFCHILRGTVTIALLQPSPETYELFDDLLLMTDGRIVYHGPLDTVLPFFEGLGFKCPQRKAVADYLQEVTSKKDQVKYAMVPGSPYVGSQQFSTAFKSTEKGKAMMEKVDKTDEYTEDDNRALWPAKYSLPKYLMFYRVLSRELMLMQRQWIFVAARFVQVGALAFVVATAFLNSQIESVFTATPYQNMLFFSVLLMFLNGMAEIPMVVAMLPVFYKQRDCRFYPSWAWGIAGVLVKIPTNILEATLWSVIIYWALPYASTPGQFFVYWFILCCTNVLSTISFRTIAAYAREEVLAQAGGALLLVLAINTSGFIISRLQIHAYMIWIYWSSPMAWAIRGLYVNEFNSMQWSFNDVATSFYYPGQTAGHAALTQRGFFTPFNWAWGAVGFLCGCGLLVMCLNFFALKFISMPKDIVSLSEDQLDQGNDTASAAQVAITVEGEATNGSKATPAPSAVEMQPSGRGQKSTLPFTPLNMVFRKMEYSVQMPGGKAGEQLTLLRQISGVFRPGVLTALMGASGAGKTTLMDVLAGRKTGGIINGDILVNGYKKVDATFARIMGYVEQFDVHSPMCTVHEALMFSARMRLSNKINNDTVASFVEEVMALVELGPLRSGVIGMPGKGGLSVEQRKRLTIAVELVANPAIVFMDEPTSGLDARAAAIVMRVVRNTVNTGRTVVCTIHQPSLDIFEAFDELLLLKRGGKTIFFGNMGPDQSTLIGHFEAVPGVNKFKLGGNPANWMLEVTTPGNEKALGVDFNAIYDSSPLCERNTALIDSLAKPAEGIQDLHFDTVYALNPMQQFFYLIKKNNTIYWRSANYNLVRIVITILYAFFYGALFWKRGCEVNTVNTITNIGGALYSSTCFLAVTNALVVLPVIQAERAVFYRERAAGYYSAGAYSQAQGLIEMPYLVAQTFLFSAVIYWMIYFQPTPGKFFLFCLYFFLLLTFFTFLGILAILITPAVQLATILVSTLVGFWNLFCGFILPQPQIPGWWIGAFWTNPIMYAIYGLLTSQLGNLRDTYVYTGSPVERPVFYLTEVGPLTEPTELAFVNFDTGNIVVQTFPVGFNGTLPIAQTVSAFVESTFGFHWDFLGWIVLIMSGMIIAVRVMSQMALILLNFQSR